MKQNILKISTSIFIGFVFVFISCSDSVNVGPDHEINIYPNPFSTVCGLQFQLVSDSYVSIIIADQSGREIKEIALGMVTDREPQYLINLTNEPSGIYNCIIDINGDVYIREITKIK